MRITEITVNLSAVIPTGSYQNYKPMYEIKAALESGEDPKVCMEAAREEIRKMFAQDWARLRSKDKIDYLNKARFYEEGNKRLPSVTTVLGWSELLYKLRNPDLFKFGGVEEDELAEYAARGTVVHRGVFQWFEDTKGGKAVPPEYQIVTSFSDLVVEQILLSESKLLVSDCNWLGFWAKHGERISFKFGERKIVNAEEGFAGRLDYYGLWDKEPAVFDIKTASKYDERKKLSYFKQMAAYASGLKGVKKPKWLVIIPLNPSNKSGFGEPLVAENSDNLLNSFRQDLKQFKADFRDLL